MSLNTCKAITQSGEKCKLKATSSGYCHKHDPERIAEREARQRAAELVRFEVPARTFSQRRGFEVVSEVIQVNSMNQELRNSLWNVLSANFFLEYSEDIFSPTTVMYCGVYVDSFIRFVWTNYFKLPLDHLSKLQSKVVEVILNLFQNGSWYKVYDFLEITLNYFKSSKLVEEINSVLEREMSGYRFVGGVFIDITSELEVEMLEHAVGDGNFPAVASLLKRALSLMSNRENPDYRNSMKESISALESLAKAITNRPKATLEDALKILESSSKLHPALKKSFSSLYAYTSDEGGIRHAMSDEPNLTASDAKFFLLSCTSFISYLKSKVQL